MADLKIDKSEAFDGETVEKVWDIKKIVIGGVVLILFLITGAYIFLPNKEVPGSISPVTLGTSTRDLTPTPALPSKESVQTIVQSAQKSLSQITSDNITSSQAAIQKVIYDLQQLQEKKDAVGAFCEVVCKK